MRRPFNHSNPYMLGVNKREIKRLSQLVSALKNNFSEKERLLINEKISKFIKRMQGAIYSRDERRELAEQAKVLQGKLLKIRIEKESESMNNTGTEIKDDEKGVGPSDVEMEKVKKVVDTMNKLKNIIDYNLFTQPVRSQICGFLQKIREDKTAIYNVRDLILKNAVLTSSEYSALKAEIAEIEKVVIE